MNVNALDKLSAASLRLLLRAAFMADPDRERGTKKIKLLEAWERARERERRESAHTSKRPEGAEE